MKIIMYNMIVLARRDRQVSYLFEKVVGDVKKGRVLDSNANEREVNDVSKKRVVNDKYSTDEFERAKHLAKR